ncbi:MAG: glycine zipper 2TM domain-containing protein [Sulfurimonas sp.]|nr:glycine zipper 2TM domain-containing protein [Sulfurimonas sp.]
MKKSICIIAATSMLLLSGCATNNGPEYDGNSYNQIKRYDTGVVIESRPVIISDDGSGKFLGAIIGAVVGSTMGRASGRTLATLGGGLAGAYAGNEIGKANASELTVELDNGDNVVVIAKGKEIFAGDRVKIIKDGSRVAQVYRID